MRTKNIFSLTVILFISVCRLVAQPCIPYPGYTTWMGYTDAWDDSSNWCPAIAPINSNPAMNVRIPGGPSGPYTYYRPVIKTGVHAITNKLRVESFDTLYIRAAAQSSLTVIDSMRILNTQSAVIINPNIDSVQVSTGTDNFPNNSPLNSNSRTRSFIAIPQSELLAQGMQAGDVICKILLHIQRKSNGEPYRNFTVKYYHFIAPVGGFGSGYTANIPTALVPGPMTIWSGDLYSNSFIPNVNDYGTIELTLQTPVIWNGSPNPVCIEICYDNTGFTTTGINDEPRFTQTGSVNHYLSIQSLTDYVMPGCNMLPSDTLTVNAIWTAGTNTINLSNPGQAANVLPGMYLYPGGQTVVSINGTVITIDSPLPSNGTGNLVLSHVRVISEPFRPNLTFVTGCNSAYKYPVNVAGHWENNGTFVPGISRVTFDGTISDQQVGGQSKTTFYDIDIANANHVIRHTDFTVQDSLSLTTGRLKLNLGLVTLLNSSVSAITRTNGYIQAETDQLNGNVHPFGRLYWKMGSAAGIRVIPFANISGISIPMDYTIVSGTHDVELGTYGTFPDNTNLPLPEVTNVIGFSNGTYNSSGNSSADRFWLLSDSLGSSPVANVTFRFAPSERAADNVSGVIAMCIQRWINSLDIWEDPTLLTGQAYTTDMVSLPVLSYVFNTSDWWVISSCGFPLGTGLNEVKQEFISVHPNPAYAGDMLNIKSKENNFHPEIISIYSTDGRKLFQLQPGKNSSEIRIPENLLPGVYMMQMKDGEKNANIRIIVLEE